MGLNTNEVEAALAARHQAPVWAFLPQVHNATGAIRARTADALAMSLWPSRGLELHGFEIKTRRSDWLKERNDPAKAEPICRYCDRWWLVLGDPAIVEEGELPPTWGLLVPNGRKLKVARAAPELLAMPMDRPFLAALLAKAAQYIVPKLEYSQEDRAALIAEGRIIGARESAVALATQKARAERAESAIAKFEEASGLRLTEYQAGHIGAAVKAVLYAHTPGQFQAEQERMLRQAESTVEYFKRTLEEFRAAQSVTKGDGNGGIVSGAEPG